jgi:hypothetical protein
MTALSHDRGNSSKRDKERLNENEDHSGRRADGGDAGRVLVVDRFDCRTRHVGQPRDVDIYDGCAGRSSRCRGRDRGRPLVDPVGGRYPITTFPPPGNKAGPELIDWSGDGAHALFYAQYAEPFLISEQE